MACKTAAASKKKK